MAKRDDLAGGRSNTSPSSPSSNTPGNTDFGNIGNSGLTTGGATTSSALGGSGLGAGATSQSTPGSSFGSSQSGGQQGQEASGLKDEAKNLAQEAKDQTKQLADQAGNHLNQLVSRQKDQAAERLGGLAGSLRDVAGKLEQDETIGNFGGYANRAAEQVDRFSNYLRNGDLSGFFRDAETTARRHPDLFLGGTFLAGLVLARFLKASNPRREALVPYDQGPQRFSSGFGSGTYGSAPSYTTERYPGAGDVSGRPYDPSPAGV